MRVKSSQPANRKFSQVMLLIAALIVTAGILAKGYSALKPYLDAPTRNLHIDREHRDIDWGWLNGGLSQIHSFRDTGRWWTNTWCGQVPFWRPLTSYVFWAMYLLWPPEYMLPRQIVLVGLHFVFTGLAALLLWRLTRRPWLVMMSLYLFAGLRPVPPVGPQAYVLPVNDALLDPKNIPDPLVGIFMLLALLALVNRRWLLSLALAVVSIGFKETGFMTWPMAAIVTAWMNRERLLATGGFGFAVERIRKNAVPIALWLAAAMVMLLIHYLTVGVGYRQGTNTYWIWRVMVFVGWPTLPNLFLFDRTAGIMSCLVFASWLVTRRKGLIIMLAGVIVAFALTVVFDTRYMETTWEISVTRIFAEGHSIDQGALCLLWLAVVWAARRDWRYVALGVTLSVIAAAPSWMAAQAWAHVRYPSSPFMEMAVAAVLIQNAKMIHGYLAELRCKYARA